MEDSPMLTEFKRACLLLLAAPALALADPIVVTTRSAGTTEMVNADLKVVPYEITITSTFDSAKVCEFDVPESTGIDHRLQTTAQIPYAIELTLGGEKFHYEGMGNGFLFYTVPDTAGMVERFKHEISVDWPGGGYSRYSVTGKGPIGSFGERGLLATRNIEGSAEMSSGFDMSWSGGVGGINFTFGDGGASSFSLQVSPVPEPASYALLVGGMLVLGLRRRVRGKTA
jgi:hypothetical protein